VTLAAPGQDTRLLDRSPTSVKPAPDRDFGDFGYVLVVEDNPINRKVIEGLLKKRGVRAEMVENGLEAVNLIKEGADPSLVLMDCQMPVMDGFAATEAIRAWELQNAKPRRPIVALTAGAFEEDRDKCVKAGMDDFLAKPLRLTDLEAVLKKWAGTDNDFDS